MQIPERWLILPDVFYYGDDGNFYYIQPLPLQEHTGQCVYKADQIVPDRRYQRTTMRLSDKEFYFSGMTGMQCIRSGIIFGGVFLHMDQTEGAINLLNIVAVHYKELK